MIEMCVDAPPSPALRTVCFHLHHPCYTTVWKIFTAFQISLCHFSL